MHRSLIYRINSRFTYYFCSINLSSIYQNQTRLSLKNSDSPDPNKTGFGFIYFLSI